MGTARRARLLSTLRRPAAPQRLRAYIAGEEHHRGRERHRQRQSGMRQCIAEIDRSDSKAEKEGCRMKGGGGTTRCRSKFGRINLDNAVHHVKAAAEKQELGHLDGPRRT